MLLGKQPNLPVNMPLVSHGLSDPGCARTTNEDRILVDDSLGLYVVCDGIGGRRRGELAASIAVETIHQYIESSGDPTEVTWPFGFNAQISFAGNRLVTAIRLANRRVWRRSEEAMDSVGMGTTITALLTDAASDAVANIGDSRAYRLRTAALEQLSRDDTALIDLPSTTPAMKSVRRILTSSVGSQETIDIHLREEPLLAGDRLLLCSDGLYSCVSDERIAQLMAADGSAEHQTAELIDAARGAGAPDNVSAIVLQCR